LRGPPAPFRLLEGSLAIGRLKVNEPPLEGHL
jgi:hypothetical protein